MKKLLLVSSLALFLFAAWSCNNHTKKGQEKEVSKAGDPIHKHGVPDQAKLDSIKNEKTKGKQ